MNIVLLSGGSGKRLWPLSNESRSKQFLKLLTGTNSEYESMVQRVYRQIKEADIGASILITASKSQKHSIISQLGSEVDLVLEPERRDTFAAIALACSFLKYENNIDDNEIVIVLPVDQYTDIEYFLTLRKIEEAVNNNSADIVLMGIKPTYPSAKYGYILTNSENDFLVKKFIEKPSTEEAEILIQNNAFWNGGVFGFKLGIMLDKIHENISFSDYKDLKLKYSSIKKISFDYEIVEKTKNIFMVPYNGTWKDLGTWNTLTEEIKGTKTGIGEIISSETCNNTHIINELAVPLIVVGANNMIIVASPDGILVSDKYQSSYLKKYTDEIDQMPMFGEMQWGEYKVLDYIANDNGDDSILQRFVILESKILKGNMSNWSYATWTILSGIATITLNEVETELKTGDTINIPSMSLYTLKTSTILQMIEIKTGKDFTNRTFD